MKIKTLRELIDKLHPVVRLMFKSSVEKDFPESLIEFKDDDDLPLSVLQKQSNSFKPLNMYGVLYSMQRDRGVKSDEGLLKKLVEALKQIEQDFPGIDTSYNYEAEPRNNNHAI